MILISLYFNLVSLYMDSGEDNLKTHLEISTDGKLLEYLRAFEEKEMYEKCAIVKLEIDARKVRNTQAILSSL